MSPSQLTLSIFVSFPCDQSPNVNDLFFEEAVSMVRPHSVASAEAFSTTADPHQRYQSCIERLQEIAAGMLDNIRPGSRPTSQLSFHGASSADLSCWQKPQNVWQPFNSPWEYRENGQKEVLNGGTNCTFSETLVSCDRPVRNVNMLPGQNLANGQANSHSENVFNNSNAELQQPVYAQYRSRVKLQAEIASPCNMQAESTHLDPQLLRFKSATPMAQSNSVYSTSANPQNPVAVQPYRPPQQHEVDLNQWPMRRRSNYGASQWLPQKTVNISTLVSGEAERPASNVFQAPFWRGAAEAKQTKWERHANELDPQVKKQILSPTEDPLASAVNTPSWRQSALEKQRKWSQCEPGEIDSRTEQLSWEQRRNSLQEKRPVWAQKAEQTHRLWEKEVAVQNDSRQTSGLWPRKEDSILQSSSSHASEQPRLLGGIAGTAQNQAVKQMRMASPLNKSTMPSRVSASAPSSHKPIVIETRTMNMGRSEPKLTPFGVRILLPLQAQNPQHPADDYGRYVVAPTSKPLEYHPQNSTARPSECSFATSYIDTDGHPVNVVRSYFTSTDRNRQLKVLTEEEKKVIDQPVDEEQNFIRRNTTTKGFRKTTRQALNPDFKPVTLSEWQEPAGCLAPSYNDYYGGDLRRRVFSFGHAITDF